VLSTVGDTLQGSDVGAGATGYVVNDTKSEQVLP